MRTAYPALLLLAFVLRCAGQALTGTHYENLPGVSVYENGYLFSWDRPAYSQITFYGRDAKPTHCVVEDKDGIYHLAWAVDSDGASAGAYESRATFQGRIDLLDPSGKFSVHH